MLRVITSEESARLDAAATDPVEVLMDRAGLAVALAAVRMGAGYGTRVAVLAGAGNNGGDGYVAARYLGRRGCAVTVHALAPPRDAEGAAAAAAAAARAAGVPIVPLAGPTSCDVVIDALFGVGFRGKLPDVVVPWLAVAPVVAVDVPSGLDAATGRAGKKAFRASATVTFHALKPGHVLGDGPDHCGRVEVADIGLRGGTPAMLVCEAGDAPRPVRNRTAHKWSAGSVAVVGGSPGITGAPMLAARAALATGAGAVAVVCPSALQPTYAALSTDVMTRAVGSGPRFGSGDVDAVLAAAERFDVMVLGPGLGAGQGDLVSGILTRWQRPLLLDADGLNALDGTEQLADRGAPTVITPHTGELARLIGAKPEHARAPDFDRAAKLPDEAGVVVLLKGNPTFVLGAERWVVRSGGSELATIGTGDVLAGAVAALWARGLDGEVAARSGAYWHGVAGATLARTGAVTADRLADTMAAFAFDGAVV
jgi:NAD(P)H-hydrate epimerase